jgi:hypothetical protein
VTLSETATLLNAAIKNRQAAGKSTDVVDVSGKVMYDFDVGVFLRFTFYLSDGDVFDLDTREMANEIWKSVQEESVTH